MGSVEKIHVIFIFSINRRSDRSGTIPGVSFVKNFIQKFNLWSATAGRRSEFYRIGYYAGC